MLSRKYRLPIQEFKNRSQKTISTPIFSVKFSPNNLSYNRLGVIISSKVLSSAAKRNFWKRRIMHNFHASPKTGLDILVIANRGLKEVSETDLRTEVNQILTKIK